MNGQMKTFIDRTCARYNEIKDKEFYFAATAADNSRSSLTQTIEGFRAFTSCLSGAKERGALLATGVWNKGDIKSTGAMREAYEMGKNI